MNHRGLRITWSVVCGLACLMVIVFWIRSYDTEDAAVGCLSSTALGVKSRMSRVAFMACRPDQNPGPWAEVVSTHIRRHPPKFSWDAPLSSGVDAMLTKIEPQWWVPEPWYEDHLGFAIVLDSPPWDMIVMPHWFLLVVAASAGSLPWIRWSRRFSLRTLLIATTLVAVMLTLAVYAA